MAKRENQPIKIATWSTRPINREQLCMAQNRAELLPLLPPLPRGNQRKPRKDRSLQNQSTKSNTNRIHQPKNKRMSNNKYCASDTKSWHLLIYDMSRGQYIQQEARSIKQHCHSRVTLVLTWQTELIRTPWHRQGKLGQHLMASLFTTGDHTEVNSIKTAS